MPLPLEKSVVLYKTDLFCFLVSAIFSIADIGSDIATCAVYFSNARYVWFGFCVGFTIAPSICMTVSYLIKHMGTLGLRSTFTSIVCLICFGSSVLKLKLFWLCIRNFSEVWSRQGYMVMMESEKRDIRSGNVYNFVEALIENVPQMVLQGYILMVQDERVHYVQYASLTISLIGLVATIAKFENSSLPGDPLRAYFIIIMSYTSFLLTARMLTIVTFLVAYEWILALILGAHFILCTVLYCIRNKERARDRDLWWVAVLLLPCYLFVFIGFKLKALRLRSFEVKLKRSLLSASLYYALFSIENILMVSFYYSNPTVRDWYSSGVTACVIMLTLIGVFVNLVFTSIYFKEYSRTRHLLRQQGARRSSRYDRNAHARFSRRLKVSPEPDKPEHLDNKRHSLAAWPVRESGGLGNPSDRRHSLPPPSPKPCSSTDT
ncbi:predicted protein [Nematostella vectensis]|uniref:XK-related protein n=1 Tax=Nematostella vectensis TaxID=45351 RepID=A7RWX4_NEMVE|nr:XK-related protein 8 [Nematostella vectensis]EDO44099.1 predicted protein [Nematostella vectensis]|eukprot:XP_001636162.1 predicted protein [Nematostella vectensis]